jgi:hypothetical protein
MVAKLKSRVCPADAHSRGDTSRECPEQSDEEIFGIAMMKDKHVLLCADRVV